MTAFVILIVAAVFVVAVSALSWLVLGKAEPRCPGCDLPESLCDCDGARRDPDSPA